MKLSTLKTVLDNPALVHKLSTELEPLMYEYISLQEKRGSSIQIRVDEDVEIIFTLEDVNTLCELFINGKLGAYELAYIADVIELADNVNYIDNDTAPIVAELVAEMTDPKVMGTFTFQRAQEIQTEIRGMQSTHSS